MRRIPTPIFPARLRAARCVLLLLLVACGSARQPRGGVVLVVLDTTRADHLSSYGYARETTPNLDRLAEEGERFSRAFAQAPWTLPAMATILSGQPPDVHGAGRAADGIFPVSPLRPEVETLAERLSAAGFATAAFTNVAWCRPESGLSRGFDYYDFRVAEDNDSEHRDARETTDAALAWARDLDTRAFLLVVHYFDPHLSYAPPAPFDTFFDEAKASVPRDFGQVRQLLRVRAGELALNPRQRESLIARYDGELRYVDREFGRLRAGLEELGLFRDALVIVVADHGEEFWDHGGFEHGHSHYPELLHVPLIVRRPEGATGVVRTGLARQLDIVPTILSHLALEVPDELPGVPLGEPVASSIAEGSLWAGDIASVRTDQGVLIVDRSGGESFFFEAGDEAEQRPLPADRAGELVDLLRELPRTRLHAAPVQPPSEEEQRQLRALGYAE